MRTMHYYIGIMSGTSADGADLALVTFDDTLSGSNKVQLHAHFFQPFSDELHKKVTSLYEPTGDNIDLMASLEIELAHFYHQAIEQLISKHQIDRQDIVAIGNHGQTIRHRPLTSETNVYPFTLQIGCQQTLSCLTGIRVIGDFRRKDVALGGQGAPLVPSFHQYLFSERNDNTFIVNLGGIANITYLPADPSENIQGFDTGPANALLDAWCEKHLEKRFDKSGEWAASGKVNEELLNCLLADEYFSQLPPKSTGREYFNLTWLSSFRFENEIPENIQATLAQLTATTIAKEVKRISPKGFVYLCGGGVLNSHCYKLIKQELNDFSVDTIHSLNLNNQAFEAMAFAWLAYAYDKKIYNQIPAVTGARKQTILGIEFTP